MKSGAASLRFGVVVQSSKVIRQGLMLQFMSEQFKFEGHLLAEFLCTRGSQSCSLFRPLSDWMKSTNTMEGNLLYSKPIDLNLISKTPLQKHPK